MKPCIEAFPGLQASCSSTQQVCKQESEPKHEGLWVDLALGVLLLGRVAVLGQQQVEEVPNVRAQASRTVATRVHAQGDYQDDSRAGEPLLALQPLGPQGLGAQSPTQENPQVPWNPPRGRDLLEAGTPLVCLRLGCTCTATADRSLSRDSPCACRGRSSSLAWCRARRRDLRPAPPLGLAREAPVGGCCGHRWSA